MVLVSMSCYDYCQLTVCHFSHVVHRFRDGLDITFGMDATVVIVPGHAYAGVRVAQGSAKFLFIDVALTGRATFETSGGGIVAAADGAGSLSSLYAASSAAAGSSWSYSRWISSRSALVLGSTAMEITGSGNVGCRP